MVVTNYIKYCLQDVLRSHNTVISDKEFQEVMADLDFDMIEVTIGDAIDARIRQAAACQEIESQMIAQGMYITEPYRFSTRNH